MSGLDAGPFLYPLVRRLDQFFEVCICQQPLGNIRSQGCDFCCMKSLQKIVSSKRCLDFSFWKPVAGDPAAHARTRYRCFLPDLAGLAGMHRAGPGN